MLDKKRNDFIKMHFKLSQTFKELKRVLPSGFMKTNIFTSSIIPNKHQYTLINLRKGKQNKESNSKYLIQDDNKNEYYFSEGNNNTKKIISKMKNYFSIDKQMDNIHSFNHDNYFIDHGNNTSINRRTIKIPKINYDFRCLHLLNDANRIKSESKLNVNDIKLNYKFNITRKSFKGFFIDNSMMKSNMNLPSITDRLKTNLPRYARQKYGLILKNFRLKYKKNLNNKAITLERGNNKKYKVIKFNKSFNVKLKKHKYLSEGKERLLSNSFFKKIKSEDMVEIKSIKKIKKM